MAKTKLTSLKMPKKPKAPKANGSAESWDRYEKKLNTFNAGKKAIQTEKSPA